MSVPYNMSVISTIEEGTGKAIHLWSGLSHLQTTLIGGVLIVTTLGAGYLVWHHKIYTEGFEACNVKVEAANEVANAKEEASLKIIQEQATEIEGLREQARRNRPSSKKAAQEIINANPVFANTSRPDSLFTQRVRELHEISSEGTND